MAILNQKRLRTVQKRRKSSDRIGSTRVFSKVSVSEGGSVSQVYCALHKTVNGETHAEALHSRAGLVLKRHFSHLDGDTVFETAKFAVCTLLWQISHATTGTTATDRLWSVRCCQCENALSVGFVIVVFSIEMSIFNRLLLFLFIRLVVDVKKIEIIYGWIFIFFGFDVFFFFRYGNISVDVWIFQCERAVWFILR